MSGFLNAVTVLDHSTVGPASRCTQILADLGANVVKVGAIGADRIEPPFYAYGAGRGTRRVRIDLKAPEGKELFLRLVAESEVVVESFRPGVADRLGVGYAECRKVNERIVYAAVSGYGRDGPYARWAGHDLNYLGVGGYLATQGRRPDGGPAMPGATVADSAGGGMQAAISILAGLVRANDGAGANLDVSTVEGVLWLTSLAVDEHLATGVEPGPGTSLLTGGFACYDVYECGDGKWLSVAAIEPQFFANLCRLLDCPDLAPMQMDPKKQDLIRATFRMAFGRRKRDEWIDELAGADTCVAPVLSVAEVAADAHLQARGAFGEAIHTERGTFRQVAPVLAGAARNGTRAAAEGSDPEEVLASFGVGEQQIAELREKGVIA
jgi:alpha-methylacyl-CoA racemase